MLLDCWSKSKSIFFYKFEKSEKCELGFCKKKLIWIGGESSMSINTNKTANMDNTYICEQINDKLGKKMSDLDYRIKYQIVYGFMPRPDYIDELNHLFDFINNYKINKHWKQFSVKKSECPKIFIQPTINNSGEIINSKMFVINGKKYLTKRIAIDSCAGYFNQSFAHKFNDKNSSNYGAGEETEYAVTFYKYVQMEKKNIIDDPIPNYYQSQKYYKKNNTDIRENCVYMIDAIYRLVRQISTCKHAYELYKLEKRKPIERITKKSLRRMVWDLVRDDPIKFMTHRYEFNIKVTYTWFNGSSGFRLDK